MFTWRISRRSAAAKLWRAGLSRQMGELAGLNDGLLKGVLWGQGLGGGVGWGGGGVGSQASLVDTVSH